MTSIRSFIKRKIREQSCITVVSGLPRSGTSMMMSALKKGGMPVLVDNIRKADQNNPKGYLEFERVKKLPKGDYDWLAIAQGKAVKIISALLTYLPECYQYKVIFLERDMDEILSSQQRMLERTNKIDEDNKSDEMLRQSYQEHIKKVSTWLEDQDWLQTLYVSYNEILRQPDIEFQKIAVFLDQLVDPQLMAQVVDPELYREKANVGNRFVA